MLTGKNILLIIGGGIAAYKVLELIRLLGKAGANVVPVMTKAAEEFVTPLSVSALAGAPVRNALFNLEEEAEMGHIQLTRDADLVVVAPATADLMAKMASGLANDLASTLLIARNKPVLLVPAMNVAMWENSATKRNVDTLREDGCLLVGPDEGDMACGEFGYGRMVEPIEIMAAIEAYFSEGPLTGKRVLVTSGPTHEPIDPVRYIANRSSGLQGTEIARALVSLGAEVIFVTGPAEAARPDGAEIIEVETALEMAAAVKDAGALDAAVFAAAVADWRVVNASQSKLKKTVNKALPELELIENPDILATVAQRTKGRPSLVIGFAAETNDVVKNATAKRLRKGCDWILANDVGGERAVMGGPDNQVVLISDSGAESWPWMSKKQVAEALALKISEALA
ncbi:MAG: bifunctional phosphopantothenoylcysteine decarboxylase/phosphopantothenate--cysteine ligase CoaBC [Rhodobacteraceae bacterium]|nr:bifunctional phosphopantothenoylcysteine decarboxylase/phosphopantothenate--cysteine ligase CoaBC [Paracoccaceae bacterium]